MRIIALLFALLLYPTQDDSVVWRIKVRQQEAFDFNGMQFFELKHAAKEIPLISLPEDSELAKFLVRHNGETIIVTFEVREP